MIAMSEDCRSTYLFNVVDLPELGFPTRPMSGSRGIVPLRTHDLLQSSMLCGAVVSKAAGEMIVYK